MKTQGQRTDIRPGRDEIIEEEIDLLELWQAIMHRLWLVILAGVAFAGAAYLLTTYMITPMYTSSSTMLVITKETTLSSLADLQLGSKLTEDYGILITSRPVLQKTIKKLKLNMDYKELRNRIHIETPNDSRMLIISTDQPSPKMAKAVVDKLAEVSAEYIADKMEVTPPKIIEEGEAPEEPSSPNVVRNTALGGMAGVLLVCFLICVSVILNDSIQTSEDIENYLEIPVLTVIPEKKGGVTRRRGRGKRKKKRNAG